MDSSTLTNILGPDGSIGRSGGLKKLVGTGVEDIDPREVNSIPLFSDSEGRTVVVCRVGARSAQVVAYLAQQGHDVVNLDGGMVEWVDAGRGLVSDTGHPPHVV